MFHYATTRDYSKDVDENWDYEKDEEAYEEYWREFLEEDERGNTNADTENTNNNGTDDNTDIVMTAATGVADRSSEENPENITPRPKLSLRFKEVRCTFFYFLISSETNFPFCLS